MAPNIRGAGEIEHQPEVMGNPQPVYQHRKWSRDPKKENRGSITTGRVSGLRSKPLIREAHVFPALHLVLAAEPLSQPPAPLTAMARLERQGEFGKLV